MPTIATDHPSEAGPHRSAGACIAMHWRRGPAALGTIVPVFDRPDPAAHRRLAITGFTLLALIFAASLFSNAWGG